jgi:hypothetical protein
MYETVGLDPFYQKKLKFDKPLIYSKVSETTVTRKSPEEVNLIIPAHYVRKNKLQ